MPSTSIADPLRSPMASLRSEENIPLKPKDAKPEPQQDSKKREWQEIDADNASPRIKKVKQPVDELTGSVAAESGLKTDTPKAVICHQCRQPVKKALTVQCTRMKRSQLNGLMGRCAIRYCNRCLLNRYGERITKIMESAPEEEDLSRHFLEMGYCWACPACRGICNCSVHRKRAGLEPTG
jgi:Zinc-finger domain of monoamine-oxidase A repressor R1